MDAQLVVLADDLTGAAETAAALGPGSTVTLWRGNALPSDALPARHLVIDTATRASAAPEAARVVSDVAAHQPRSARLMLKIDSLLRSHAGEIGALQRGRTVLVCPALPALGRRVRGGRTFIGAKPLDETDAWRLEPRRPPASIADWLHPRDVEQIGLAALRGGSASLRKGRIHVCDAETDADLDLVAALAVRSPDTLLAGSAAAVAAGASALDRRCVVGHETHERHAADQPARERGLLLVIGTGALSAREQVAELGLAGVTEVRLTADVGDAALQRVRAVLAVQGTVAVAWAPEVSPDVGPSAMSTRLARRLAPVIRETGADLFLTGGQTARSVLDELAVRVLTVVDDVTHGVVLSVSDDGRLVGTRPGSFGGRGSLVDVTAAMRQHRTADVLHVPGHVRTERGSS